jgi:hypothetical protein
MGFFDIVSGKRFRENRLAALSCGDPIKRAFVTSRNAYEKASALALSNGVELTVRNLLTDKKYPVYERIGRAADIGAVRFAAYTAWMFTPLLLKDGLVSTTLDDVFTLTETMYPQDDAVRSAVERRMKNDSAGWSQGEDALQNYKFRNLGIADGLLEASEPTDLYEAVDRTLFHSRCELSGRAMVVKFLAELIEHPEYMK